MTKMEETEQTKQKVQIKKGRLTLPALVLAGMVVFGGCSTGNEIDNGKEPVNPNNSGNPTNPVTPGNNPGNSGGEGTSAEVMNSEGLYPCEVEMRNGSQRIIAKQNARCTDIGCSSKISHAYSAEEVYVGQIMGIGRKKGLGTWHTTTGGKPWLVNKTLSAGAGRPCLTNEEIAEAERITEMGLR